MVQTGTSILIRHEIPSEPVEKCSFHVKLPQTGTEFEPSLGVFDLLKLLGVLGLMDLLGTLDTSKGLLKFSESSGSSGSPESPGYFSSAKSSGDLQVSWAFSTVCICSV